MSRPCPATKLFVYLASKLSPCVQAACISARDGKSCQALPRPARWTEARSVLAASSGRVPTTRCIMTFSAFASLNFLKRTCSCDRGDQERGG